MNNDNIKQDFTNEKITNQLTLKELMVLEAIKKINNPFVNLTVQDVAKDLKMGLNLTNELFKRKDFPSVNIGKQKTVTLLAYLLWKMKKQEDRKKVNSNERN